MGHGCDIAACTLCSNLRYCIEGYLVMRKMSFLGSGLLPSSLRLLAFFGLLLLVDKLVASTTKYLLMVVRRKNAGLCCLVHLKSL